MFQDEMMTCYMCGTQQKSDPNTESNWRAIEYQRNLYYICPNELPPDGASQEEYKQAYQVILEKIIAK